MVPEPRRLAAETHMCLESTRGVPPLCLNCKQIPSYILCLPQLQYYPLASGKRSATLRPSSDSQWHAAVAKILHALPVEGPTMYHSQSAVPWLNVQLYSGLRYVLPFTCLRTYTSTYKSSASYRCQHILAPAWPSLQAQSPTNWPASSVETASHSRARSVRCHCTKRVLRESLQQLWGPAVEGL